MGNGSNLTGEGERIEEKMKEKKMEMVIQESGERTKKQQQIKV